MNELLLQNHQQQQQQQQQQLLLLLLLVYVQQELLQLKKPQDRLPQQLLQPNETLPGEDRVVSYCSSSSSKLDVLRTLMNGEA